MTLSVQQRSFSLCEQKVNLLNSYSQCLPINQAISCSELWIEEGNFDVYKMIFAERVTLFSNAVIYVTEASIARQREIISAIESVIKIPAYQQRVLAYAPDSAKFIPQAHSVFFGYDFHQTPEGPKLIEINTNAGGALLNAMVFRIQKIGVDLSGASLVEDISDLAPIHCPEETFIQMFLEEWQAERGQAPLESIAIVDENPQAQYMLPEFLLFKRLFEKRNIQAVICDPSELRYRDQALWYENQRIDLVYNRLTDFSLEAGLYKPLLEAYYEKRVVVTPHPRAHALYADKRNLALLTDEATLIEWGVDAGIRAILMNGIAHTLLVNSSEADTLWASRKKLFFKPAKGYGSKATYRGDKLTKKVFAEILQGDYVAQTLVQPSERQLDVEAERVRFKLDMRHYVYKCETQLISARLYQGQTTNFRTLGGGFTQVIVVSCRDPKREIA